MVTTGTATRKQAERPADPRPEVEAPPVPETLQETGLTDAFVTDLLLKTLYAQGARTGDQLSNYIRLPFGILDDITLTLQQRRLIEVRGTEGVGRRGYTFDLTAEGRARAREIVGTNRYIGPAPVELSQYWKWATAQSVRKSPITRDRILDGLRHLVLPEELIDQLGPAVNSGKSMFLYGHAGNGKTALAEAIAAMLGGAIYTPYALEVEGQVIQLYDPVAHVEAEGGKKKSTNDFLIAAPEHDPRWVCIRRPVVMVGGELTLDDLELQYDSQTGAFKAPPQVKANGGVFIIDDFGRQRTRPRDLLNRWMVPLDRDVDFLSLPMGHKIPVPFECLLIFATNLDPSDLVEEAFLRRIRYKILVGNPTRDQYAEIFRRCCEARDIEYDEEAVEHIFFEYYGRRGIGPRACHPRDLVNHLCDLGQYLQQEPRLDKELLQMACRSYFLDTSHTEGEEAHVT